LTAQPDLPALLLEVLDATMELEGADFGRIQLYDESSQSLRIVAHRGVGPDFLDHFARADAKDTSACGRALCTGTRVIISDVELEPDYRPHLAIAASTGYRAVITTPLVDGGRLVGMLTTLFRKPHRPSARMLRLTDLHARLAAEAITARLAKERRRQNEARLQSAVDLVKLGLYAWNPETGALQWDAAVKAMWGLPAENDVDYATWLRAIHPDDRPRVEAAIGACSDPRRQRRVRRGVSRHRTAGRRGAVGRDARPDALRQGDAGLLLWCRARRGA
jgi:PAS domain-containing protein